MNLESLNEKLKQKEDLTEEEAVFAAQALTEPGDSHAVKESFLLALDEKGETVAEVAAFAKTFRGLARETGLDDYSDQAIDVCGTGGDRLGTFNISTAVMFILAAAGIPVLKHGNRSISSKCGSAEFLNALGVPSSNDPTVLRSSMEQLGFAFFFAPAFHPAFKEIMPVRKALAEKGKKSVFNILGPLINPAAPAYQVLGVFAEEKMTLMARVLDDLGLNNGYTVHCRLPGGSGGMDELSCAGDNLMRGVGRNSGKVELVSLSSLALQRCPITDLLGGDTAENVALFHRILDGKGPTGLVDTIVLNAGVALVVAGKVNHLDESLAHTREILLGGRVRALVDRIPEAFSSV